MKKIISSLAVMAIALGFVVACGGGGDSDPVNNNEDDSGTETQDPVFPDGWDSQKIPILGWKGIPESLASSFTYSDFKNAGFSINLESFSADGLKKAFSLGESNDVKILPQGYDSDEYLDENKVKAVVDQLKGEEAFAGYSITDEPKADKFDRLGTIVKNFQKYDQEHPCYINLFPNYAGTQDLGASSYEEYVNTFLEKVPVTVLSFDNYPILVDGDQNPYIRDNWFENLEIIRKAALKYDREMWAFILCSQHWSYAPCEVSYMKIQAYANLAYGAKCLQYFTYWRVMNEMSSAPLNDNGQKMAVYDNVKQVNTEIQNRARVFVNSNVTNVYHIGTSLPSGVTQCPNSASPYFSSISFSGEDATVSLIENGSVKYLMVVNTSLDQGILTIEFPSDVKEILSSGGEIEVSKSRNFKLRSGDAVIYIVS